MSSTNYIDAHATRSVVHTPSQPQLESSREATVRPADTDRYLLDAASTSAYTKRLESSLAAVQAISVELNASVADSRGPFGKQVCGVVCELTNAWKALEGALRSSALTYGHVRMAQKAGHDLQDLFTLEHRAVQCLPQQEKTAYEAFLDGLKREELYKDLPAELIEVLSGIHQRQARVLQYLLAEAKQVKVWRETRGGALGVVSLDDMLLGCYVPTAASLGVLRTLFTIANLLDLGGPLRASCSAMASADATIHLLWVQQHGHLDARVADLGSRCKQNWIDSLQDPDVYKQLCESTKSIKALSEQLEREYISHQVRPDGVDSNLHKEMQSHHAKAYNHVANFPRRLEAPFMPKLWRTPVFDR